MNHCFSAAFSEYMRIEFDIKLYNFKNYFKANRTLLINQLTSFMIYTIGLDYMKRKTICFLLKDSLASTTTEVHRTIPTTFHNQNTTVKNVVRIIVFPLSHGYNLGRV